MFNQRLPYFFGAIDARQREKWQHQNETIYLEQITLRD